MPRPFSCTIFRGFYFWLRPNMISIQKKHVRSSLSESKGSCSNRSIAKVWKTTGNNMSQWNFMSFHAKKTSNQIDNNYTISWKNHGCFSGRSRGTPHPIHLQDIGETTDVTIDFKLSFKLWVNPRATAASPFAATAWGRWRFLLVVIAHRRSFLGK